MRMVKFSEFIRKGDDLNWDEIKALLLRENHDLRYSAQPQLKSFSSCSQIVAPRRSHTHTHTHAKLSAIIMIAKE